MANKTYPGNKMKDFPDGTKISKNVEKGGSIKSQDKGTSSGFKPLTTGEGLIKSAANESASGGANITGGKYKGPQSKIGSK